MNTGYKPNLKCPTFNPIPNPAHQLVITTNYTITFILAAMNVSNIYVS